MGVRVHLAATGTRSLDFEHMFVFFFFDLQNEALNSVFLFPFLFFDWSL